MDEPGDDELDDDEFIEAEDADYEPDAVPADDDDRFVGEEDDLDDEYDDDDERIVPIDDEPIDDEPLDD